MTTEQTSKPTDLDDFNDGRKFAGNRTYGIAASFDFLAETIGQPRVEDLADGKHCIWWSLNDEYNCEIQIWTFTDEVPSLTTKWSANGCRRLAIELVGEDYVTE